MEELIAILIFFIILNVLLLFAVNAYRVLRIIGFLTAAKLKNPQAKNGNLVYRYMGVFAFFEQSPDKMDSPELFVNEKYSRFLDRIHSMFRVLSISLALLILIVIIVSGVNEIL